MSSRFIQVVEWIRISFLWLNNIPLYGYTIFCSPIHQLMNIYVVSTFWLLWITWLWTFAYKFSCGCMLSVFLGTYLRTELLSHVVTLCLTFWGTDKVFQSGCTNLHSHQQRMRVLISPHPHQHLLLSVFFLTAILMGIKWYHIVILIYISLITPFLRCHLYFTFLVYVFLIWGLTSFVEQVPHRVGEPWVSGPDCPGFESFLSFY